MSLIKYIMNCSVHKTAGLVFLTVVLCLAACSAGPKTQSKNDSIIKPAITFVDDFDRSVSVSKTPDRIVSLAPGCTEIIYALKSGDKVVGVDDYSNYPDQVISVEKIGSYDAPSIEKIIALKPDLVFADSIHKIAVEKLEELGMPVAVVSPSNLEGVLKSIRWIGTAIGAEEEAEQLLATLLERFSLVDKLVASISPQNRPSVYYELYSHPIITCGPNTLGSELIARAGGLNIAHDAATNYPEFSPETIVARNPDIIIFPEMSQMGPDFAKTIRTRPGWANIRAVQNGRLYGIDDDILSRPGPRVVEALEEMVRLFHPDV